jgi:pimeloyl-ACP methyl ester carboxylesterase
MSLACPNPIDTRVAIAQDGFTAPDGREIVLWRWPRSEVRPTLHWAHATGFHGRLYAPLLDALASDCNVLAWDMRGHGASAGAADIATFRGWETYYQDLTAWLAAQEAPVWLAGHSIGATTSLMAAARRPDKVLGLILVEPVIMDRWQGWRLRLAQAAGPVAAVLTGRGRGTPPPGVRLTGHGAQQLSRPRGIPDLAGRVA